MSLGSTQLEYADLFSLIFLLVTATGGGATLPSGMISLDQREIRALIVGKDIATTEELPPGLDYQTTERFWPDGKYLRYFHGKESLGTYFFRADELCVRVGSRKENCRAAFKDSNEDLWLMNKRSDKLVQLRRYIISDIPR